MKKILLIVFLFFIIFSIFIYILLYYFFNIFPENNFLNRKFRFSFTSNLFLRPLFKLHQIGDARSDYISDQNFKSLKITIYSPYRDSFSEDFKNTLISRLSQITDKPEGILIEEKNLNLSNLSNLSDLNLSEILKSHPVSLKSSAQLQIFLLESYAETPTNIGLVKDAYNIFLFSKPLEDISHFEKTTDNAYLSTILHEFAHLLGAGHVEKDGCIMSEKVEDIAFGRPAEIATTFCPEDLEEINKAQH